MRRFVLICVAIGAVGLTSASAAGAAGWAIQPTPNPTGPQSTLSGVSCTSATACTAVGYGPDSTGTIVTLAERWDGTAWTIQPTPNAAGATSGSLDGVSCSSMTACMAVGHYLNAAGTVVTISEAWDGSAWTIEPTPNPASATASALTGVSCSSATACTAVGNYNIGASLQLTLVERWNGSNWNIESSPNPVGSSAAVLKGVSCSTDSACTAVGSNGFSRPLAERWDGTAWTIQSTPGVAGSTFEGVSCSSPDACTAVGESSGQGLAERWDGSSWTIQSTPDPVVSSFVYLRGVSCSMSSACTAVGFYTNSAGTQVTLAEVWDGTAWTIQSTPNPAGPFIGLCGVSCRATSACTAVGIDDSVTLGERWDGSSWTIQPTPNLAAAADANLDGGSCSTVSQCISVGVYGSGSGTLLAEAWDGSSWRILDRPPVPAGARGSRLDGVSCMSPTSCVAVGSYFDSGGATQMLAEGWDGSSWSLQPVTAPRDAKTSFLAGVSCVGPTECVAVGNYVNIAGTTVTLIEAWNGTSWSPVQSPNPAAATDSELHGVSCSTAASCTAVGFYEDTSGQDLPLAEATNGGAWVLHAAPLPAGANNGGDFAAVSCSAATACSAVGVYTNSQTGFLVGLVERWDGSAWTVETAATPVTAVSVLLFGITCMSSTQCTSVGYYSDSNSHPFTLAESWDGASWTVQPSPNPPGAHGSTFAAVSCPTTTDCTAVGSSFGASPNGGDGPLVTLAEGYTAPPPRVATSLMAAPQLVIFPPPVGAGLGTVSARLLSGGSPLAGRPISFDLFGIPLCTAVTGADGTATCQLGFFAELLVLYANYYSARFSGDETHLPSSASTPAIRLGLFGLARDARLHPRRHVSIVGGSLTRGRVRYAVLVKRADHGVRRLGFKAVRRIRPGRYTITVKLTGGAKVRRTVVIGSSRHRT